MFQNKKIFFVCSFLAMAFMLFSVWAETPPEFKDPVTGLELVFVKGGCFKMGDLFGDGDNDEKPAHEVCVDDFYMGKYEVTVGEFKKFVMDTGYRTDAEKGNGCFYQTGSKWEKDKTKNWRKPGFPQNDEHPVVCVSWNDASAFTKWLLKKTEKKYRLPTEAEWEYAATSAGKRYKYSWGKEKPSGNIADESALKSFPDWAIWSGYNDGYVYTAPVGSFKSNELGLFDMSGNVWEWVQDWYDENYYKNSPKNNPKGSRIGRKRVFRGGSWILPRSVRVSNRDSGETSLRYSDLGFRVLISP